MFPRQRLHDCVHYNHVIIASCLRHNIIITRLFAFLYEKKKEVQCLLYGCGTNIEFNTFLLVDFFFFFNPCPTSLLHLVVFFRSSCLISFVRVPRHRSFSFPFRLSHFIVVSWSIGFVCDVTSVSALGFEYMLRGDVPVSLCSLLRGQCTSTSCRELLVSVHLHLVGSPSGQCTSTSCRSLSVCAPWSVYIYIL